MPTQAYIHSVQKIDEVTYLFTFANGKSKTITLNWTSTIYLKDAYARFPYCESLTTAYADDYIDINYYDESLNTYVEYCKKLSLMTKEVFESLFSKIAYTKPYILLPDNEELPIRDFIGNQGDKLLYVETCASLVRFYIGNKATTNYYGDDWNDAPFDCNASPVYNEFISYTVVYKLPENYTVLELSDMLKTTAMLTMHDLIQMHIPMGCIYDSNTEQYVAIFDLDRPVKPIFKQLGIPIKTRKGS
jgi:hypothetical protein